MTGAITNTDALKRWFYANSKPYFTLRYDNGQAADRIIFRNDSIGDMDAAWERLEQAVVDQAEAGKCNLSVIVYDMGKHNNPNGTTRIEMRPGNYLPGAPAAGISGLPAGIGSVADYVDMKVRMAQLEWENEQLKEQVAAPATGWERTLESLAGIPGFADVAKMLAAGIVSKISPEATPVIQGILNGTPTEDAARGAANTDDDAVNNDDPETRFSNNIQDTARMLGTDPVTLSEKLAALVRQNPELAKQMLQS